MLNQNSDLDYFTNFVLVNKTSINIGVLGLSGAGKSSLIKTMINMISGEELIEHCVPIRTNQSEQMTKHFKSYQLTKFIKLWDLYGWTKEAFENGEFKRILNGTLPDGHEMNSNEDSEISQKIENKMDFIVIVIDPSQAENEMQFLETVRTKILKESENAGCKVICVLTKVDKLEEINMGKLIELKSNDAMAKIQSNQRFNELKEKIRDQLGDRNFKVFPVLNYTSEDCVIKIKNYSVALLLKSMLKSIAEDSQIENVHCEPWKEFDIFEGETVIRIPFYDKIFQ
jgi:predicted GTPase